MGKRGEAAVAEREAVAHAAALECLAVGCPTVREVLGRMAESAAVLGSPGDSAELGQLGARVGAVPVVARAVGYAAGRDAGWAAAVAKWRETDTAYKTRLAELEAELAALRAQAEAAAAGGGEEAGHDGAEA